MNRCRRRPPLLMLLFVTTAALWGPLAAGCAKVSYPKCKTDEQCHDRHEVCVQGTCQQCRTDAHCEQAYPGEKRSCQAGRCAEPGDCHSDQDCVAAGLAGPCHDGRCVDACHSDSDCPSGQACQQGRCHAGCADDSGCAPGHRCVQGRCQAQVHSTDAATAALAPACMPPAGEVGAVVNLPPVTFAFNTSELPADTQNALQQIAACIAQAPATLQVVVEGHCDDRGTQEYNLALGQRRAQSVVDYLVRLGVNAQRLQVRSKGENEPTCAEANEACYAANRRVAFLQNLQSGF